MKNNIPDQSSQKFSGEEWNSMDSTLRAKIRNFAAELSELAVMNYQMESECMSAISIAKRSEVTMDDEFCLDADDRYVDEEGITWEAYWNGRYANKLWKPKRINGIISWRPNIKKRETK